MSRYIEEKDVIDGIRNNLVAGDYIYWQGEDVEDEVAEFPSADVAPVVHGKWKYTVTGYLYCSNCDWMPEEDEMLHTDYYCPNCGARMDGGKED